MDKRGAEETGGKYKTREISGKECSAEHEEKKFFFAISGSGGGEKDK